MAAAALVLVEHRDVGPLEPIREQARGFILQAKAPATLRAYRSDWRDFEGWCEGNRLRALPATPETVAFYLSDRAGTHKVASIQRRVSAVSQAHQCAGHDSPTKTIVVRAVLAGIRRALGTAQQGKDALLVEDVRAIVATLPAGLLGVRDRALLLLGFAGAFRRSELVSLDVEDCNFGKDGLTVTLRRSKTDQEGEGRKVGVPYGSNPETCPVRALQAWLEALGITEGPIFRSVQHGRIQPGRLCDRAVALVVKRYAAASGKDARRFAGHSLRAGLVTSAAIAGCSERSIMAQTGHRSTLMVRRYIRDANLFRENAAARVGL